MIRDLEKPTLSLLIAEDNKTYQKKLTSFFTSLFEKWPLARANQLCWEIHTCASLEEFEDKSSQLVSHYNSIPPL